MVIIVRETVRARSCCDVGVTYNLVVQLEQALGDRELVDGACVQPDHERRPDC